MTLAKIRKKQQRSKYYYLTSTSTWTKIKRTWGIEHQATIRNLLRKSSQEDDRLKKRLVLLELPWSSQRKEVLRRKNNKLKPTLEKKEEKISKHQGRHKAR